MAFNLLCLSQTLPPGTALSLNPAGTQLRWHERVLLDAQRDGFMSIKEIVSSPDQKQFVVIACGYECNDNAGFLLRADGGGKRKFTARWDAILQSAVEWSDDGRRLYYYRINSSGATAPRGAPAEGWIAVDVRTGAKTKAAMRKLKATTSYAVFNVGSNDVLNVRTSPDGNAAISGTLAHNTKGVRVTGAAVRVGGNNWVSIQAQGLTGWVNQNYLCEEHSITKTN
ncbi:MAG: SH3 domain-containing protein [Acidobacteria bacterium]|nr:SH3 domain-containing protein [Acidobacteriota bacterium]MBI3425463.1 SH3 domain-containing protein [Acidobacteriota bacterium]